MADKMDMSLDDIIELNRRGSRGTRTSRERGRQNRSSGNTGVNRGGVNRRRKNLDYFSQQTREVPDVWKHDLYDGSSEPVRRAGGGSSTGGSAKLLVSNLEFGVSDSDIQELFSEFGPLIKAAIHFDRSGCSLGTAEVIYQKHADAVKALKQYNNVPLDGRPMNIQLIEPSPLGNTTSGGGGSRYGSSSFRSDNKSTRFRGRGQEKKQTPTLAELDAQLDAYNARVDVV